MDSRSSDLTSEREDLQSILTHSVPGLVSDSKRVDTSDDIQAGNVLDGSATGHRLLVDPNVFNMAILLPPSLVFISRLKEVVPQGSDIAVSTLTSFLDDFLINVFLPQLEETVGEMSSQILIESNSFSADPLWSTAARKPIFKGTAKFYRLIEAFCEMLDILPHDSNFSQLIINQLVTYYSKCYGWYKAMAARTTQHPVTGNRWRISADLADQTVFKEITNEIMKAVDDTQKHAAIRKEIAMLLDTIGKTKLEEADLILDRRSLSNMSLLSTSMKWLSDKILTLRFISQQNAPTSVDTKRQSDRYERQRRWTLITAQAQSEPDHVYLPLTEEIAPAFDGAQSSFAELAATVTRMLHVEMRAHIFFYLSKVLSRTFSIDREVHEPDPEIAILNADLMTFDEDLSAHLHPTQRAYITTGLSGLVDAILVTSVTSLQGMNAPGAGKLLLAILVLQQNLKNVEATGASLARAASFYEAFSEGNGTEVVKLAKRTGKTGEFSEAEVMSLARLVFGEQLSSERRDVVVKAEKEQDEVLREIAQAMG
jgi:exocyst complex component 4